MEHIYSVGAIFSVGTISMPLGVTICVLGYGVSGRHALLAAGVLLFGSSKQFVTAALL